MAGDLFDFDRPITRGSEARAIIYDSAPRDECPDFHEARLARITPQARAEAKALQDNLNAQEYQPKGDAPYWEDVVKAVREGGYYRSHRRS